MDKLFDAEKTLRTRTLGLTNIEVNNLKRKYQAEKEQPVLQKCIRGGKDNVASIKTALQISMSQVEEGNDLSAYQPGQLAPLLSQDFSLCKLLWAAHIQGIQMTPKTPDDYVCCCLPQLAVMPRGCVHTKISLSQPRIPYSRHLCHLCMQCYRCGRSLAASSGVSFELLKSLSCVLAILQ